MGGTDQLDHLSLVGWRTIERAHAHAAEANSRDLEFFVREYAFALLPSLAFCTAKLGEFGGSRPRRSKYEIPGTNPNQL
jgi:hypothetical protein